MASKKIIGTLKAVLLVGAGGTLGWAFYSLVNESLADLVGMIGVQGKYAVPLVIIGLMAGLLFVMGKKTKILDSIK